ncbi:MAG: tRNA (adenosine(37)-N6)-threonylcarbamoyltransferase complex dimerization subunit type 1 TsaB [Lachnospiraceae bacterium]|nr:tRNA (adenosine(37)-N6)-threonylcarbamoyltransferase complex dimerization subunit type 1 TsaB [Lachnospiraceae bacterium]
MKILAIDSSGLVATVAVLEDNRMLAEYTINFKKTHSQTLVPMMNEIKEMIELDLNTIDAIAVAKGPGSFTGLRIGSATAKGLGLALKKPIISVPTLDALAFNLWGCERYICPMMDARREQVYTGVYHFSKGELIIDKEGCAIPVKELIEYINEQGKETVFLGDGVPVYKNALEEGLRVSFDYAPGHAAGQRAGALGVLALRYLKDGITESAADHKPDYLRLSQAERERAEKLGNKQS